MQIEVVLAWSRGYRAVTLELPEGACVADALNAAAFEEAGLATGMSVFGVNATPQTVLNDGDRVELLRPLLIDPKEARRRRAAGP
ncbi:RnfH family protein [Pseudoxanthomonas sp.]|uniref:RnfH family protein n=1 Tax=Pseudoxanthomonas sp. TaxID=1871049 RepID=UPI00261A395B|nr:RnfH family protein [Pseudoxanthomonas sp.]WDS38049.1 MAG: RnfH family protein [Pseudoxanthomonas sp.]